MKKLIFILLLFTPIVSFAQDFGPRTFPLVPKGLTSYNLNYARIHSKMTPSKDVILEKGTVDVDAVVIPFAHSFSIAGHLSQVFISTGFGRIDGKIDIGDKQYDVVDVDGLLDANVMMRVGLLNTPALDLEEFVKHDLQFQLSGLLNITVPIGQYERTRRVNLGGNRWAFQLGMPMILPLNNNKEKVFLWEIVPSVTFYTDNTEPLAGDVKTQDPLFWLEQHFSKNFTKRFWASINMDYQYGGKTYVDGVSSGNVINQFGAGVTVAYAPFASIPLIFRGSYSNTWFDGTSGYTVLFGASLRVPPKQRDKNLKN